MVLGFCSYQSVWWNFFSINNEIINRTLILLLKNGSSLSYNSISVSFLAFTQAFIPTFIKVPNKKLF